MVTITQSTPHAYMLGVKDESTRRIPVDPITLSSHLPYMLFFAEKGPSTPQLIRGVGAVAKYGSRTFDLTSEYTTHQTPFIQYALEENNPVLLQRIIPENAKTALLRISVEVIPAELPMYERNDDGSIKYTHDAYDQRVPVIDQTQVVDGHRLVFHTTLEPYAAQIGKKMSELDGVDLFGSSQSVVGYRQGSTQAKQGTLTLGKDGESSTLYPVMDLLVADPGGYGNRLGLRLQLPHSKSAAALDVASVYANLAYIMRVGIVERSIDGESVTQHETSLGDLFLDVCFKEGSRTDRTNIPLEFEDRIISGYRVETAGQAVIYDSPFKHIHVYRENIEEIVTKLVEKEQVYNAQREAFGSMAVTEHTPFLMNFLGGADEHGIRYYTLDTQNSAIFDGVVVSQDSVFYAQLGDDGLPKKPSGEFDVLGIYELYDRKVREIFENLDSTRTIQFQNYAKYPLSAIWDTGFSLNTKKALANALAHRKDVAVITSTYAAADYKTTLVQGRPTKIYEWSKRLGVEEEISIATMLRANLMLFPESEVYGTKVCRGMVIGYSGKVINSEYRRDLPLTYDFFTKVVAYMGSSTGIWDGGEAYDLDGNNIVDTMKDISITWMKQNAKNQAWNRGLVYVEDYDSERLFYPGIRTVYSDETSVLNSSITMFAICLIERVCHQTWRKLSGNSKWTPAKFIEESDRAIEDALTHVFDDRFIIRPETTYTGADLQRGFSWATKVHIYANNMKTVGAYTVVAHRMEDYQAQNASLNQ